MLNPTLPRPLHCTQYHPVLDLVTRLCTFVPQAYDSYRYAQVKSLLWYIVIRKEQSQQSPQSVNMDLQCFALDLQAFLDARGRGTHPFRSFAKQRSERGERSCIRCCGPRKKSPEPSQSEILLKNSLKFCWVNFLPAVECSCFIRRHSLYQSGRSKLHHI